MGLIRGGLLLFVGIILLLSLIVGNVLLVVSSSLDYDNLQENVKPIIVDAISKEIDVSDIEDNFNEIKEYCLEQAEEISIVEEKDFDFEIDCDLILESTPETFLDKQAEKFISDNYYKNYDCDFIDCFDNEGVPFFLVSEQSKNYVSGKYYLFLAISGILAIMMFLLCMNKKNFLMVFGIILILSALPFMFLNNFSFDSEYGSQISRLFFGEASFVFWKMFLAGIFVLGLGIALRFWNFEKVKQKTELKRRKENAIFELNKLKEIFKQKKSKKGK